MKPPDLSKETRDRRRVWVDWKMGDWDWKGIIEEKEEEVIQAHYADC